MKKYTLSLGIIFIIASAFYSQMGAAMPSDMQPSKWAAFPAFTIAATPTEDDGREEDDQDDNDQCELIFPFCEAN